MSHFSAEDLVPTTLPDLSRFEMQCLRLLWRLGEGSVRDLHERLEDGPSYSTVRKIVERLEEKKAVTRVRLAGKAWIYRPAVTPVAMMRKEIRRFLDALFDGSAAPLVAHLADMDALTGDDLREIEKQLARTSRKGSRSERRAGRVETRRNPGRSRP
jgi:BlaI family penicillinase repressor